MTLERCLLRVNYEHEKAKAMSEISSPLYVSKCARSCQLVASLEMRLRVAEESLHPSSRRLFIFILTS